MRPDHRHSQPSRAGFDDITTIQKMDAEQNVHSIYVPNVRSERVQGGAEED
jgi:hypothetical protein